MHARHQIKRTTRSHHCSAKFPFDIWESRLESSWPSFCMETATGLQREINISFVCHCPWLQWGSSIWERRECVCGSVRLEICVGAWKCIVWVYGCAVTWRIDANRGQLTQGFARIQYIMKGLYVESNMLQFSGSSWKVKPWETTADLQHHRLCLTIM